MSAVEIVLAEYLARARTARLCPAKHPESADLCVLRWGHTSPHKTDLSSRWSA